MAQHHSSNGREVSDSCTFSSNETRGRSGPDSGGFLSMQIILPQDEDPRLVKRDEKYECPVCVKNNSTHRLLRNPIQTTCGHRMCKSCVAVYLGDKLSRKCPLNEDDCEQVTRENVIPDPGCQREIKQLLVYCCYNSNGCPKTIKFAMLEAHKTECEFQTVQCSYLSRGCKTLVLLKDLDVHLTDCEYRPVICELCGTECNFNYKEKHDEEDCPEANVNCPYSCETLHLKRRQLQDHTNVCPRKPETCSFKSLGCPFTGSKEEVRDHEKDITVHFQQFMECFTSFKLQADVQQRDIEGFQQLSGEHAKFKERIESSLKTLHKDLKLKMVQQLERTIIAEQKVSELVEAMASSSQLNESLHRSVEQLKSLIPQVATHDRQIAGFNIQMATMDLRFQMAETASYDGSLLWKISDFSKRKKDAEEGRTVSLYSQPFYTSRYGYKMCARVYPNGDGIGQGTHMSLYFVVMKGECDALLPWPFQCKVCLMLLDQSPGKRHLKDEFIPDPASSSFKRPTNVEMNVASGCPLFVSHTVLYNQSNNYIRDDVLFIKIVTDTMNLQPI